MIFKRGNNDLAQEGIQRVCSLQQVLLPIRVFQQCCSRLQHHLILCVQHLCSTQLACASSLVHCLKLPKWRGRNCVRVCVCVAPWVLSISYQSLYKYIYSLGFTGVTAYCLMCSLNRAHTVLPCTFALYIRTIFGFAYKSASQHSFYVQCVKVSVILNSCNFQVASQPQRFFCNFW